MKTCIKRSSAILICILAFISCQEKKPKFTIEGTISNADSSVLYLEKRSLTETITIDSIILNKSGEFIFVETANQYSEFYLLRLHEQTINLSIDSTETIKINAPKTTFAIDYTIEGSDDSKKIKEITLAQYQLSNTIINLEKSFESKNITQDQYLNDIQQAIDTYKNLAKNIIYSDPNSMASYFALFQKIDNLLIFDPYNKEDIRLFQATATAWAEFKKTSPRAEHIRNFTLAALAERRKITSHESPLNNIENVETTSTNTYYNISLPNIKNNEISLSSLKGKIVVLDFTAYETEYSYAHNILINKAYTKYNSAIEIYQVSLDSDIHIWQNTATNLPWICVRDAASLKSNLVTKFNVQGLPTTFLLDRNGNIVKRVLPTEDLVLAIQKIL